MSTPPDTPAIERTAPAEPPQLRQPDASNRIGRIVAVTGGHAIILLDTNDQAATRSPEIGTLLKVETGDAIAMALVSALSSPMPSSSSSEPELRIVEVEFIGELPIDASGQPASFRRGVSSYPSLGDIVSRATKPELEKVYFCDTNAAIRIGSIKQDQSIPATLKIDELLGKHFAVVGTTGTGKSCAVALILRRILERSPHGHIMLLDVHREYARPFSDLAEVMSPENMNLPFWLLNFEEIAEILVGQHQNRETDAEILSELIPLAKQRYMANVRRDRGRSMRQRDILDFQSIGVDTPVPYRASDLMSLIEEQMGRLDMKNDLAPYKRLKAKLESVTRDQRFQFMFGNLTVHDTMAQVLGRLFRIPVEGRPMSILELGGLPSEVINVVVSVLARLAFDLGLWSGGRVPITFVCEEAHRYVPIDRNHGFDPTKRSISRIAKEGRKYGVSLCIVSQRPAELDPTILSQCNTIFAMRLSNERDQEIVRAGISDAAASMLEFMPTMGTGEAVAFGEGVALPTRIVFDILAADRLPHSATASFIENWSSEIGSGDFLVDVVSRWRNQSMGSPQGESGGRPQPERALDAAMAPQASEKPVQRLSGGQASSGPSAATPLQQPPQGSQHPLPPQAGATAPPQEPAAPAAAPANAATGGRGGDQVDLAALIRQLRPGLDRTRR